MLSRTRPAFTSTAMLQNPLTYEIMTPHSVGVPDSRLVLGKHSGRHALAVRCSALGYTFDRRDLDEIYRRFVVLADRIKLVEDHDLLPLIVEVHSQSAGLPAAGKAQPSNRLRPGVDLRDQNFELYGSQELFMARPANHYRKDPGRAL